VRTTHRREHPVARVLKRKMKMRRVALRRSDEVDDLPRAVHRLERRDAEEDPWRVASLPTIQSAQQRDQRPSRSQGATIRAQLHTNPAPPRRPLPRPTPPAGPLAGRPTADCVASEHPAAQPPHGPPPGPAAARAPQSAAAPSAAPPPTTPSSADPPSDLQLLN